MKIFYTALIYSMVLVSCKKQNKDTVAPTLANHSKDSTTIIKKELPNKNNECTIDSLAMQTTEYNGTTFYTENNLRGSGVINLSINKNTEIFNMDKTPYGKILVNNDDENVYDVKLPKVVIAREIIPDSEHRIFSFDAEEPGSDKDFLIIYINKQKKLIEKKNNDYAFNSWENYIKTAFIQLTPEISNTSKEEQLYWYKSLKIKGDSMQIKSIPKADCDYIEEYKNVTKWIQWKKGSCKLIKFNFCY
ncbi:hypothetical protein FW781_15070 [Chryseobacterium panacisoli]|uniref:Lipoprotein n=1 Tax=Chryseobacterium panacisoli TaxID=1807141 RepID=A0A5D8ZM91_9FLAO|nr:hypothetical protein [Chryseobacterium panacisoli]TZF95212.1 hypothetical protein FW781_15070 [Chryseobacterium panacisoli]